MALRPAVCGCGGSESQRRCGHDVGRGLGGIAGVAVDDLLAVDDAVARAGISVAEIFLVEEIVDREAQAHLPDAKEVAEGVGQMEVGDEICVEPCFGAAGVVHVLLPDVAALERGVGSEEGEVEGVAEDEVGGEGYGGVAEADGDGVGPSVLVDIFGEVLDAVAREGHVEVPAEPPAGLQRGLQLDAGAV